MATTALTPAAATYRSGLYEWLTTTDHKKIGILYVVNSFIFFFLAGILALLVRSELAQPGIQFLQDEHVYNQLFTMHGTVMIFLFIIPMLVGFGNYVVPLQLGAPDMAFPRINALSFWMLPLGGILLFLGFVAGGAAAAGWTSYAPLSEDRIGGLASSGPGQDLWIMGLTLIGTSSILGGINFLVTIFKMRAPGLTMFRLPILVWTVLVTSILQVLATPVLTSALIMLFIDRNYGGHFFDPSTGGSAIMWQNIFWFYSHPAVYIMVLPAMGMISEILPVFSRKPLFGYKAFVFATAGIGALGFSVWAHHMFTTGQVFLPFFSLMTFLIAVPTGVKMFNWIFTLWRGKLTFSTPLLFALGFLSMFLIGGINGAFSAAVPVDFALQDTYWVVAHLHYVLFGGSVFGVFAGVYYWFPKMTGRMLNEALGKLQFVLIFVGFNLTFFPMHQLGLAGMPRRIADYASNVGWNELNLLATIGGFTIALSMIPFLWNVAISLRNGQIAGDDPWEANTLEWATSSPPPPYNFDHLPEIRSERPLFDVRHGRTKPAAVMPDPGPAPQPTH
ncbi:MAG TPA: cytochrome c oxidase subunit I [Candidatus Limnocylindrales bacterium]|jgi:cytochrome c oxidase subunit 1|nr:cytochrome c oxidase subunit I [Candidatus Limnocylindrales bacterium]